MAPEKPSCKVPCIPRADSTLAAPVARAEPVTRAEGLVTRADHVTREVREEQRAGSPDRDESPGYHRWVSL